MDIGLTDTRLMDIGLTGTRLMDTGLMDTGVNGHPRDFRINPRSISNK